MKELKNSKELKGQLVTLTCQLQKAIDDELNTEAEVYKHEHQLKNKIEEMLKLKSGYVNLHAYSTIEFEVYFENSSMRKRVIYNSGELSIKVHNENYSSLEEFQSAMKEVERVYNIIHSEEFQSIITEYKLEHKRLRALNNEKSNIRLDIYKNIEEFAKNSIGNSNGVFYYSKDQDKYILFSTKYAYDCKVGRNNYKYNRSIDREIHSVFDTIIYTILKGE